jgi:hypothetical protein
MDQQVRKAVPHLVELARFFFLAELFGLSPAARQFRHH